jgi:hypothetical protein
VYHRPRGARGSPHPHSGASPSGVAPSGLAWGAGQPPPTLDGVHTPNAMSHGSSTPPPRSPVLRGGGGRRRSPLRVVSGASPSTHQMRSACDPPGRLGTPPSHRRQHLEKDRRQGQALAATTRPAGRFSPTQAAQYRQERLQLVLLGKASARWRLRALHRCFRAWLLEHTRQQRRALGQELRRSAEARSAAESRALEAADTLEFDTRGSASLKRIALRYQRRWRGAHAERSALERRAARWATVGREATAALESARAESAALAGRVDAASELLRHALRAAAAAEEVARGAGREGELEPLEDPRGFWEAEEEMLLGSLDLGAALSREEEEGIYRRLAELDTLRSRHEAQVSRPAPPPRPIDAPCTQGLRHGDPIHAKKGLTLAARL